MWLLDATTFALFSVDDPSQVRYAAVSHVWNALGEPSFQDIQALHTEIERTLGSEPDDEQVQAYIEGHGNHAFWSKIASACAFARAHGYQYIWIDTCCINKMSSAELSEAVNSMFEWYAQASVCYAYLHDVPDHEYPSGERSKFRSSKWFKRGWTLQELVAPRFVVFLSKDWTVLGTKHVLARVIEEITHISRAVLTHEESLDAVSIAERMSWASERQTTRVEDEAYSLLGIFGIHMPTIYGEGNQAFIRLQEEILRRIPDQSLFAWGSSISLQSPSDPQRLLVSTVDNDPSVPPPRSAYLFAPSTTEFYNSTGLSPMSLQGFSQRLSVVDIQPPQYITTSYGLRARLPIMQLDIGEPGDEVTVIVALLACQNPQGSIPALVLFSKNEPNQYSVGGYAFRPLDSAVSPLEYSAPRSVIRRQKFPRFIFLHPAVLSHLCTSSPRRVAHWENIYVLHRPLRITTRLPLRFALASPGIPGPRHSPFAGSCDIIIPRYTSSCLTDAGYVFADLCVTQGSPIAVRSTNQRYSIAFWQDQTTINAPEYIKIGFELCDDQAFPRNARPLHVAIIDWCTIQEQQRGSADSGQWSGISSIIADCDKYRVQNWEDGEKIFTFNHLSKSLRLKFTEWYFEPTPLADHGVGEAPPRAAYAMDITFIDHASHLMGQYSPSDASSVTTVQSPPLQWDAAPWETPPPSWLSRTSVTEPEIGPPSSYGTPYSEEMSPSPIIPPLPPLPVLSPSSSIPPPPPPPPPPNRDGQPFGPGIVTHPIKSILRSRPPSSPSFIPPSPATPSFIISPRASPGPAFEIPPPPTPNNTSEDGDDYGEGEFFLRARPPDTNWWDPTSNPSYPAQTAYIGYGAGHDTIRAGQLTALRSILSDPSYRRSGRNEAQEEGPRVRFKTAEARPTPW